MWPHPHARGFNDRHQVRPKNFAVAPARGRPGTSNPRAQLTEEQVKKICVLLDQGVSPRVIGISFGVDAKAIRNIDQERRGGTCPKWLVPCTRRRRDGEVDGAVERREQPKRLPLKAVPLVLAGQGGAKN
jgi:hypothetical protein